MNKQDFKEFSLIWKSAVEIVGKSISDTALGLAFTVLSKYDIKIIKEALSAHLSDPQKGQFIPKPADIVYQISKHFENDGRPDANEAWSIAIDSFDENKTVVMNNEIVLSLEFARGIYLDGDKVGARMAFKESYDKAIADARGTQQPIEWWPSIGFDKHGRESVLRDAVLKGQLKAQHVNGLLPAHITSDGLKAMEKVRDQLKLTDK